MSTNRWPNFSDSEMQCHCGCGNGIRNMDPGFMDDLQALRTKFGKPIRITSGFRCSNHNRSVSSTGESGPHTTGKAVDIQIGGSDAHELLRIAVQLGFRGIGISQKGDYSGRFIHLDMCAAPDFPRPMVWSY